MLTKASVVDDLGIVPNYRGSIFCKTAGLTYFFTIWSSASLDKIGVREMGRRCLLISLVGLCFGTGTTSASFAVVKSHYEHVFRSQRFKVPMK